MENINFKQGYVSKEDWIKLCKVKDNITHAFHTPPLDSIKISNKDYYSLDMLEELDVLEDSITIFQGLINTLKSIYKYSNADDNDEDEFEEYGVFSSFIYYTKKDFYDAIGNNNSLYRGASVYIVSEQQTYYIDSEWNLK